MIWCLNFKAQFAESVERGNKTQTVRALRKDGRVPVAGDTAKLYQGLRTKATRLLRAETAIVLVERINIREDKVFIDGQELTRPELCEFAMRDGFCDSPSPSAEFLDFFCQTHGDAFDGFVVYWRAA